MSTNIDTGKRVSKITYNGVDLPMPDTDSSYEAGVQSEYNRFWDEFQTDASGGIRGNYYYAFAGYGWKPETLRPKNKISFTENTSTDQHAAGMFYRCCQNTGKAEDRIDFSTIADKFDFSGLKSARNMFDSCNMVNISVDFSNVEVATNTFARTWGGFMDNITIKVTDKLTNCSNMIAANTITNLTFTADSVIACNGLNVSSCTGLTHDSLMSIINALQKKSSGTWTLTLGTTNLAKLTDAEKAIATHQKGWSLA
jgi:hypothetical protein